MIIINKIIITSVIPIYSAIYSALFGDFQSKHWNLYFNNSALSSRPILSRADRSWGSRPMTCGALARIIVAGSPVDIWPGSWWPRCAADAAPAQGADLSQYN